MKKHRGKTVNKGNRNAGTKNAGSRESPGTNYSKQRKQSGKIPVFLVPHWGRGLAELCSAKCHLSNRAKNRKAFRGLVLRQSESFPPFRLSFLGGLPLCLLPFCSHFVYLPQNIPELSEKKSEVLRDECI
ncbi:MAG: hypothetical protein HY544_03970 [Candidatus Diapherotrites archaeon]|uniref:Uncharacterized protein n=1 Tax=Candidatus Iainarchaeum sp. TaxID=3101447 RepID=A0A8T3YKR3_9ARCH|nr:hypothetical protein [Candidatus Diapherotrites archaeon]